MCMIYMYVYILLHVIETYDIHTIHMHRLYENIRSLPPRLFKSMAIWQFGTTTAIRTFAECLSDLGPGDLGSLESFALTWPDMAIMLSC